MFTWLNVCATTWAEPWQDDVIKKADHFVLAEMTCYHPVDGFNLKILKTLAGAPLQDDVKVTGFHMLDLCSSSGGSGNLFYFEALGNYYFLLTRNAEGELCIPTPSSGFAYLEGDKVYATYRHSYHLALVDVDVYENTMTAIFNHYHNLPFDSSWVQRYVEEQLARQPAGFEADEIDTFFSQHVALESVYHLRLGGFYNDLLPFLADSENMHHQTSAARALIAYNTQACKEELMKYIGSIEMDIFAQVQCIQTLSEFKPVELKERLTALLELASDDENGFETNLMDPRICTYVPSVKEALANMLENL